MAMALRTYARVALVPTVLVAGCPGDDTAASGDSSSSSGESTSSTTQSITNTETTSATTSMPTTSADTSSGGSSEESSSTDVTQGSSESSSSETTNGSSESSSTGVDLCGNGAVDGSEQCDGADLNGADCTDVGFDAGTLGCNSACLFDTFNCIIYICGNNGIDPGEFCDGTDLSGADCASEGFPLGGELGCTASCDDYDLSGCLTQLCGNDTIEGTEVCDGSALAGDSCAAHGFAGGDLTCNAGCTNVTYAACSPGNAQFTYVVNDSAPNSITAYAVDPDGLLTELPGSPFATGGSGGFDHHPDAIVNCGAYLYAANSISGDISGFFVEADGSLTGIAGSPFALANIVGLSCNDGYLFATTFDDSVSRFSIGADGSLTSLGTVTAAPDTLGTTVDPTANRLFVAGFDTAINVYDIDGAGDLAAVPGSPFLHGGSNYSVSVSPDGAFAASEGVGGVRIWSVAGNGALAQIAGSPFADTSGCDVVGLAWAPDASRLFVGHHNCSPGVISVYDVAGNGALTEIAGSPFLSGGDDTVGLAVSPNGDRLFATHIASNSTSVFDIGDAGELVAVAGSPFANGVSGNHSWVAVRGGGAHGCQAPFGAASYDAAFTFSDPAMMSGTRMTVAWDGTNYWTSAGGFVATNLASVDVDGNVVAYYNPGFDNRSYFTKGDGTSPVYQRSYGDAQIHVESGPGVYVNDVVLAGGVPDDQSGVVWDDDNRYFIAHSYGTVTRWDETGAYVDSVILGDWGNQGTEAFGIQGRGIAWACGYFYTYSDGILSAWDVDGNRVATTTLNGASTGGDAYYSYSIANGMFFVSDGTFGLWRGYDAL
jgi:6-phosphogluconolactonase (cycloisomerase 2 family)